MQRACVALYFSSFIVNLDNDAGRFLALGMAQGISKLGTRDVRIALFFCTPK